MLEWVVLGVTGVLLPRRALWSAEVVAAATWLRGQGIAAPDLTSDILRRFQNEDPAPIGRALAAAGVELPAGGARHLLLATRQAVPEPAPADVRSLLQALASRHRLALLDTGPGPRLDAWLASSSLLDRVSHRLWTQDLGHQAQPPRRLPFRWLAGRLAARPAECLYVSGNAGLAAAARAAGWHVLDLAGRPASPHLEPGDVLEAVERAISGTVV